MLANLKQIFDLFLRRCWGVRGQATNVFVNTDPPKRKQGGRPPFYKSYPDPSLCGAKPPKEVLRKEFSFRNPNIFDVRGSKRGVR